MDLRENLELIEVVYENDNKKAVLTFLDPEQGQVLEVNFNKQSYDNDVEEFVEDKEKADKVDEWCEKYFDTTFLKLSDCIGSKKDVYVYSSFNSLWEATEFFKPEKFNIKEKGQIYQTNINEIVVDHIGIHIRYEINDKMYQTNMNYANWVDTMRKWFENPQKKEKQLNSFKDKFGVSVDKKDELVGKPIMVEVRQIGRDGTWGDIKKPNNW